VFVRHPAGKEWELCLFVERPWHDSTMIIESTYINNKQIFNKNNYLGNKIPEIHRGMKTTRKYVYRVFTSGTNKIGIIYS